MDAITISTIASTVVSLLVPFMKSTIEGISKKAGEEIGSKTGNLAWEKANQLYDTIKTKFSSSPEATKIVNALEKDPDDSDTQAALRFQIKDMLAKDENFAKELAFLLKEASEAGADTVFQTTIMGNVQKLVQMGNVYGDVKI
jgi:hypothetical protein